MNVRTRSIFAGTVLAIVAATATVMPGRSGAASDPKAIRKVDFRNFTYSGFEDAPTKIVNGTYTRESQDDPLYVEVRDVDHGDLDGDGVEEAVVSVLSNTGGTGQFTDGRVFKMVSGKPVEVTTLGIGDRADGGIDDIVIVSGVLRVERYVNGGGGACCPTLLERKTFKLKGSKLVETAKLFVRRLITFGANEGGENGMTKISFLKGTSEAVIDATGGQSGYFDAGKGQKVTLTLKPPPDGKVSVKITGPAGTKVVLTAPAVWSTTLQAAGRYVLDLPATGATEGEPSTRMTLTIR
jgi:hypothetical protein